MGQKPPRLTLVLTAVLFSLSCFGFTLFVWKSFGGTVPLEPKGYRFEVPFGTEATQLTVNAEVRVAGVKVGRVVRVAQERGGTQATLELEPRYAPIASDAHAIIRFKTLLGESFVELTRGTQGVPKVPEGGSLRRENVGAVQSLDQVLAAFDRPTRAAFKRFLRDTADALDGRGRDINEAIGNAAPATENLADLAEILDRQQDSLQALIRDSGRALGAVASREADLQRLIDAGDSVLSATAERERDVTATIRSLPPFLGELRRTLETVEGTAVDAAPVLRDLRSAAPLLKPAIDETLRLAPELQRVFTSLGPVITSARTGLPSLTHVVDALRPLMGTLYVAGRELVPVIELVGAFKHELITAQANLGAATQGSATRPDGVNRHYLRVLTPFTNESVVGASRREPTNRHNPYLPPGGLAQLAAGLPASDCRNTSNPATVPPIGAGAGPPPCKEQPPWTFRGATRYFPHVEKDGE